ncbi:MAG: DUF5821 family protein [Halovenus sp.]
MPESAVFGADIGEVLSVGLTDAKGDVLVINPSRRMTRRLVNQLGETDGSSVRLFADGRVLKDLTEDFLVASEIADLVEHDLLSVRTLGNVPRHSLLLAESFLLSLVESEKRAAGLVTTTDQFVADANAEYDRRWDEAEPFTLRTPALSRVRETLEVDISPAAARDFDAMLGALETARGNGAGLDEVEIALLVAANNGELLYDISRWGEDVSLASKATFSRSKNRLEDSGLLDTEKVPIDVGRPRLRLQLGSVAPESAPPAEILAVAQQKLS